MDKIEQALTLLTEVVEDYTVPKNIRENSKLAQNHLQDESLDMSVRIDKAIQLLDEVSEDPNMPTYTRTQIWGVVSLLESMLSK